MKKLTSMLDQFNEPNFSEASISKIRTSVNKALGESGLVEVSKKYKSLIMWAWLMILATIGLACLFFVTPIAGAAALAPLIGSIILFVSAGKQKGIWNSTINSAVNQNEMLRTLLDDKYENVKMKGVAEASYGRIARTYRSKDIPSDANVSNDFGGIDLLLNDRLVSTRRVTWHWVRRYCDSKGRCTTKHYYKDNFYMISVDFAERFEGFTFKMSDSSLFNNSGKELENEKFNKQFSYVHNDPVKLRVLLTPFIQETFVNNARNLNGYSSTAFFKEKDHYTLVKTLSGTPFTIDAKMASDINAITESIVQDMISDARYILDNLSFVATFRELVK